MVLVDTHCHLNDREAFPDVESAISEAVDSGVKDLIVIGVDLDSSLYATELAQKYANIWSVVGWHPNYASEYKSEYLREIKDLLGNEKVIALGEIGLDFYRDHASAEDQNRCLQEQLELAGELSVPVVFHCRSAYPELLEILVRRQRQKYLFHCFAGDEEQAKVAVELDCWFGVDGPITYKKSQNLKHVIQQLPRNKLLIETDSPWMTPEPFRGQRNRPALLPLINSALAQTLGISNDECAELTTRNASEFFGIKF